MNKETMEKIFEYASMPLHGTLSRKLRKGLRLQVNEGKIHDQAVLFLGDGFIRITDEEEGLMSNTYYGWDCVASIRTLGASNGNSGEEKGCE